MKVLLVADNCSRKMGGEAILPYHYFRLLSRKGISVKMLVHERTRAEMEELFPDSKDDFHFISDTKAQKVLWNLGCKIPRRVAEISFFFLVFLSTNLRMRKAARRIVAECGIDLVHQVTPVAPKAPSFIHGLGVPVMIGPMNGGMEFPPAFRKTIGLAERVSYRIGKSLGALINVLIPGKHRAALLVTASPRIAGLVRELVGPRQRVEVEFENGVDLALWQVPVQVPDTPVPEFSFVGRLVDWKGVNYLLLAFKELLKDTPAVLNIIGGGEEQDRLVAMAAELGISSQVRFMGFMAQDQIPPILVRSRALVLPSIFECGGAVVLEAMALQKPAIVTAWGGPADYVNPECGILVAPDSAEALVQGFAEGMRRLARDPELARRLGEAGRRRIEAEFDWDRKAEKIIAYYRELAPGA